MLPLCVLSQWILFNDSAKWAFCRRVATRLYISHLSSVFLHLIRFNLPKRGNSGVTNGCLKGGITACVCALCEYSTINDRKEIANNISPPPLIYCVQNCMKTFDFCEFAKRMREHDDLLNVPTTAAGSPAHFFTALKVLIPDQCGRT